MEPARDGTGDDGGTRVHRALSSPVRAHLLRLLVGDPSEAGSGGGSEGGGEVPEGGGEVPELAAALGLHVNTVRAHLAVLQEAGLVGAEPDPRGRPGRPRLVYRPTAAALTVLAPRTGAAPEPGYRVLAELLAGQLASSTERPAEVAAELGASWGRGSVGAQLTGPLDAEPAIERVVALLDQAGFGPERAVGPDGQVQVWLHRCPFAEVARHQPDVVCSVHLGFLRGALEALGSDVEVADLTPFVRPDRCLAELRVPAPGRG
jgi:predicted ArsR family transcriptional regulator